MAHILDKGAPRKSRSRGKILRIDLMASDLRYQLIEVATELVGYATQKARDKVNDLVGAADSILERDRDEIYDVIQDGHTYFPVASKDEHTLAFMRGYGSGYHVTGQRGERHPYAVSHPWFRALPGHEKEFGIHIQRSEGGEDTDTGYSIFDNLMKQEFIGDHIHRYMIVFGNSREDKERWDQLRYGTSKMVGRRVDLEIKNDFQDLVKEDFRQSIKRELRSRK